jgi:uncharacterized protein (UPF0297 family)
MKLKKKAFKVTVTYDTSECTEKDIKNILDERLRKLVYSGYSTSHDILKIVVSARSPELRKPMVTKP